MIDTFNFFDNSCIDHPAVDRDHSNFEEWGFRALQKFELGCNQCHEAVAEQPQEISDEETFNDSDCLCELGKNIVCVSADGPSVRKNLLREFKESSYLRVLS